MRKEILRGNRLKPLLAFIFLLAAALAMSACGSGSYDEPTATSTPSPLIEAATLKGWVDQGLVNADSWEKVVILDYGTTAAERIPGACRVATGELRAFRLEGVAVAAAMVATGAQMDAVIQRLGIDENTTIVFTSGVANMSTRAYWTFRYWGFPKARLKVLDGDNAAWTAGYATTAPTVTASTYSVTDIGALRDDLRASLGEMITMVTDGDNGVTALTVDARGADGYNGNTKTKGMYEDVANSDPNYRTVFEGHPTGGKFLAAGDLFDGIYYKSPSAIKTLFENINWTSSMTVYAYCTSGYTGSQIFFVLDALLDAPVQLYDGSFSQWGQMAVIVTDALPVDGIDDDTGATLPALASNWATDSLTSTGGVPGQTWNCTLAPAPNNIVALALIEQLRVDTAAVGLYPDPSSPAANQIENEDTEYIQSGGAAPAPTGGDSGGGC